MDPELTQDERALLAEGLRQWGGSPAQTDELALALGFRDARHFYEEAGPSAGELDSGGLLEIVDVRRALSATEVVFASDTLGAGVEWPTVTGRTDEDTLRTLRSVQRKIAGQ